MPKRFLPGLLCMLVAAGGCARTDDGTVEIPRHLDMRRVDLGPLDLRHPGRMKPARTTPLVVATTPEPFPVSPQARAVGERRVRVRAQNRRAVPAPATTEAKAGQPQGIACQPATQSGERIRMRCE